MLIYVISGDKNGETTQENGTDKTKDDESSRPARKAVKNDAVDKKVQTIHLL